MYGHALVGKAVSLAGSIIGGTTQIAEMLDLAAEKNIKAWIQLRPMSSAAQSVRDMEDGKSRYRFVLEN
jgi:alcohol dehydrogenase (NADP+)